MNLIIFEKYIELLKGRTLNFIETTDVQESCTATLLLIFAAIDSISKITCNDVDFKKGNKKRFTSFLESEMLGNYSIFKDQIYSLRNDIVHTGINTKVVLYKSNDHHMHLTSDNGILWINSKKFTIDFKYSLNKVVKNICQHGKYNHNISSRMKTFNLIEINDSKQNVSPSPGPDEELFVL